MDSTAGDPTDDRLAALPNLPASVLAERLDSVAADLAARAADDEFSGVVLVTEGDLPLLEKAYGVASRRWNTPVTTDMRFDVASITKLFTSVAVLQQVAAGTLRLDSSIHDYVDLEGTTISRDVTLRHLLTHTSGIADDADEEDGESYEALWAERPNYSVTETADFLPQFAHKPPRAEPGADCRYCNVGYVLAGLALERATGRAYRDVVRTDVFEKAGMTSSGFFDMREAAPNVAEGWDPVREGASDDEPHADGPDEDAPAGPIIGWRQNIYSYPPIGSPDGGAHSTAADLVRFVDALRGGELLPKKWTTEFLSPQVLHHADEDAGAGETAELAYGFGLEFEVTPAGELRSFYKDGINAGASAIVRYYPATNLTVAVLSNSEDGAWDPITAIDDAITLPE
ncbi:CubicO group peptidase (beta-lactamase class C family) [Labedella gwakjiensis]|uniref:Class A beta-lactamase-related serine hydrolase n=1 Tax=Labedella gwakjiensis TaxID=390269 RepID=A0A2P8GVT4_9MICO|nr:serine hydrolase domain-containing protein [Labedella gwakjiensis]PSL38076.1 CubicO group peptidase (beta-lactamase class C family) [Labedella gwakjiensis]RUQ87366.1 class A beta-lactamase-related serine hydrolase [Labedella gwakjiensis]